MKQHDSRSAGVLLNGDTEITSAPATQRQARFALKRFETH
jgi:hypothetical protein